jgi:hypothetical protein
MTGLMNLYNRGEVLQKEFTLKKESHSSPKNNMNIRVRGLSFLPFFSIATIKV